MGALHMLRETQPFNVLLPTELEQIVAVGQTRVFERDEIVFRQGDAAESLFLIQFGLLQFLFRQPGKEKEIELAQLGAGRIVGDITINERLTRRSASAVALERSELLEIRSDALSFYLECNPAVADRFYLEMARQLLNSQRVFVV